MDRYEKFPLSSPIRKPQTAQTQSSSIYIFFIISPGSAFTDIFKEPVDGIFNFFFEACKKQGLDCQIACGNIFPASVLPFSGKDPLSSFPDKRLEIFAFCQIFLFFKSRDDKRCSPNLFPRRAITFV